MGCLENRLPTGECIDGGCSLALSSSVDVCPDDELSTSETPESAGLGGSEPAKRTGGKISEEEIKKPNNLFIFYRLFIQCVEFGPGVKKQIEGFMQVLCLNNDIFLIGTRSP